jgi:hypothetical protein
MRDETRRFAFLGDLRVKADPPPTLFFLAI